MAAAKQIAEFSFKSTSLTYTATDGGGSVQVNYEGSAKGEGLTGPVLGTLTAKGTPGAKSGTCSWAGIQYLDNGEELSSQAGGTWQKTGTHKWRLRGMSHMSDGRTLAFDGVVDLATRSFSGTLSE
jgi:hypothetical protein